MLWLGASGVNMVQIMPEALGRYTMHPVDALSEKRPSTRF